MEQKKIQLIHIHGGDFFDKREDYIKFLKTRPISLNRKKWHAEFLKKELGDAFHIIKPQMPLREMANYEDWKIHFERYLELLGEDIILLGTSLGGTFLAKYLSEHKIQKNILAIYLVCPPFYSSIHTQKYCGEFLLKEDLNLINENCNKVRLFFSKTDKIVPIKHASLYKTKLPKAEFFIYEDKKGHFVVSEFPEIVEMIKKDLKQF